MMDWAEAPPEVEGFESVSSPLVRARFAGGVIGGGENTQAGAAPCGGGV